MEKPPQFQEQESEEQDFSELLNLVKRMEDLAESDSLPREEMASQSKELIAELLAHLESDLHLGLSQDVTALYAEMQRENLLARVEDVTSVIECVTGGSPIRVGSEDRHYANSVSADLEGLRIAMAEADTIGPVRLLVGLDLKALVGFTTDHLSVSEIDDNDFDIRDTNLRKAFCRHVVGEIRREDIRYIVMRIPRDYFPDDSLLPEEIESDGRFIFRGAKLPKELDSEALPQAA